MRIALKNIVYLTDFSHPSEAGLPYAKAMAKAFDAKVYALHVLVADVVSYRTPEAPLAALEAMGKVATTRMSQLDSHFASVRQESIVERADNLWAVLEPEFRQNGVDLVVLETHGTQIRRFLMRSTAEIVLRKSSVPVMIIGPGVRASAAAKERKFRRILLATDLRHDSEKASGYVVSLAQENQAELLWLHVIEQPTRRNRRPVEVLSVAEAMHRLQALVPADAESWCRAETVVALGHPGTQIVDVARRRHADLVVLGVRGAEHQFAATHWWTRTAQEVIARATCPVLCVPTQHCKFD